MTDFCNANNSGPTHTMIHFQRLPPINRFVNTSSKIKTRKRESIAQNQQQQQQQNNMLRTKALAIQ